MAKSDTSKSADIWIAALCIFLYGREVVVGIDEFDGRRSEWMLSIPEEDLKIIDDDYRNGSTAVSDVKAFVNSFNIATAMQRDMRNSGTSYRSNRWINGEVA